MSQLSYISVHTQQHGGDTLSTDKTGGQLCNLTCQWGWREGDKYRWTRRLVEIKHVVNTRSAAKQKRTHSHTHTHSCHILDDFNTLSKNTRALQSLSEHHIYTHTYEKRGREYRTCMCAMEICACGPEVDLKMSLETKREELLAALSASYFCA